MSPFSTCDSALEISDEGLEALGQIAALNELGLSLCNKITDTGLYDVGHLSTLTTLNLKYIMKVTDD